MDEIFQTGRGDLEKKKRGWEGRGNDRRTGLPERIIVLLEILKEEENGVLSPL